MKKVIPIMTSMRIMLLRVAISWKRKLKLILNAFATFVMTIPIRNTMTKVQMIAIRPFSPPNFN